MGYCLSSNPAKRIASGRARDECVRRLETQVATRKMRVIRADIGRIADNNVKFFDIAQCTEPVAFNKLHIACFQIAGILLGQR